MEDNAVCGVCGGMPPNPHGGDVTCPRCGREYKKRPAVQVDEPTMLESIAKCPGVEIFREIDGTFWIETPDNCREITRDELRQLVYEIVRLADKEE